MRTGVAMGSVWVWSVWVWEDVRGQEGTGLTAGGDVVEFAVKVGEEDMDGGAGNGEGLGGEGVQTVRVGGPGAAADGIDEPDAGYAGGDVIVDALLHVGEGIAGRENLDAEHGWLEQNTAGRAVGPDSADVGDTEAIGGDLYALLGECPQAPGCTVGRKESDQIALDSGMGCFTHGSLLGLAVDVVAVGPVGGGEVLGDGDEDGGGHRLMTEVRVRSGVG